MGALHQGHGALFEEARRRCPAVVASIFVNPIQFDQNSDYDLYPRFLKDDIAFCTAHGVDYIFASQENEMYPEPQRVFVEVGEVSEHLCGRSRPGHFRGVATVVLQLFQIVQPHLSFFMESETLLRSKHGLQKSYTVSQISRSNISIWSTRIQFDPSTSYKHLFELHWRYGLAKRDLPIMSFANPRVCQLGTARIIQKVATPQQN